MVPRFLRSFFEKSAAWARAEARLELLRCGYPARCSGTGCRDGATTIVRYLDTHDRPLRQIAVMCDEHAERMKREQHRTSVRDLRDSA